VKNQTLKQIRLWNKPSNFWRFYLFSKLGFSVESIYCTINLQFYWY